MNNKTKKKSLRTLLFLFAATGCISLAACTKEKVTFSFAVNGGTEIGAAEVEKGSEYSLPAPTRNGYIFEGWYTREDFSGDPVEKITDASGDLTFYAKWAKAQTITLNLDGGTLAVTSVTAKAGAKLSDALADYVPAKAGYEFGAWLDADGKEISKKATLEEDITLTAKYKVGYTVEIYRQNVEQTDYVKDEQSLVYYDYAGKTVSADEKFRGFEATEHEGTVSKITLTDTPSENVLKLYFDRVEFTVTYDVTYPDGTDKPQNRKASVLYGKSTQVPCDYTAEGYYLLGWSTRNGGEAEYTVDALNHILYGNASDKETSAEITPESDVRLYAVWQKGYYDMFGGNDYIYLFGEDIYLSRGGYFFKGTYNKDNSSFTFNVSAAVANQLKGRLLEDGSGRFVYIDNSHNGMASRYAYLDGVIDTETISYQSESFTYTNSETGTSTGTYEIDENGYYVATFTAGSRSGETVTFMVGALSDGTYGYIERKDSEMMELCRFFVQNNELYSSFATTAGDGYLGLTLDGFGLASLNTGTTANPSISNAYYKFDGDDLVLYTSSSEEAARLRVIEEKGTKGYMYYVDTLDRTITKADGSSITGDGVYNLSYTYKNSDGKTVTVAGKFSYQSSVQGTLVGMGGADNSNYLFLITSSETGSTDGSSSVTYSFERKPSAYAEYYFQSENGTQPGPLLVIDDKEKGKASIYEYVSDGQSYVLASEGTYTHDEEKDLYTYTTAAHYSVTGGTGYYDVEKLAVAVFYLDSQSTSYSVYYWQSMTMEDGTVNDYEKQYTSSSGDGATLTKIGGIMIVDKQGGKFTGSYTSSTLVGNVYLYEITSAYTGGSVYAKVDETNGTFELLWTAPVSIHPLDAYGQEDSSKSFYFDGTGTAEEGSATYTVNVETIIEGKKQTKSTTYYGTFKYSAAEESEDETIIAEPKYTFIGQTKGEESKSIEISFLWVTSSSATQIYVYNKEICGHYVSSELGTLWLDGYGFCATYTPKGGSTLKGYYILDSDMKTLLAFVSTNEDFYLFDISADGGNKTFTARGTEYGTYEFFDNQELTGYSAKLDGLGKLTILKNSGEDETVVQENVSYTKTGTDSISFAYTEDGTTKSVEGELAVYSNGTETKSLFVVYHEETIAKTYINTADYSLLVLDRAGNATIYAKNGRKEDGAYTLIADNLLFYQNEDATDASLYRYYSETRTVEKCDYPNAYSYYSSDLKTLIFTRYGLARVGGEIYYYEPTYNDEYGQTDGVTLYRKSDSSSANAYGYEATPFLKFVDENPDRGPEDSTPPTLVPPKTVEFDGIIYYYNQDEHITFSRNAEGKTNYPIALSNDQKGYITGLKFASDGTENFSVSGTVTFGYKVTSDGEEEEKEVSGTCTVTREVTSDGGYKLYVTFGYYRFEISVNYNGDSKDSTFTVTGLSYIHTYTSYNYTFLKAIYAMYGIDVDLTDPGTISILANYDEDGNQVGKPKLVTAFTKESGFEDTEGNIFAVNNEFEYTKVESGEDGSYDSYVADFDGEDGQKYRIYVSAQDLSASSVSLSVYQMTIVIVETLTDETSGYTATTERIMASDSSYTRGAIYGIVISKDDTEYEADYIFRLKANDPYTYVYRKLDDDGKATETKYFTFKLTENDKSVNDDFALYKSVDIKYVGEATVYYTASGTNTFVDIMNDKVKLIVYEMSIYIVDECKYDEETTTYTITTTDGKSYSVKMVTTEDGKAVIEVTPIEAATDTEDTAGESTDTEDTAGDSSADDSAD